MEHGPRRRRTRDAGRIHFHLHAIFINQSRDFSELLRFWLRHEHLPLGVLRSGFLRFLQVTVIGLVIASLVVAGARYLVAALDGGYHFRRLKVAGEHDSPAGDR